MKLIEGDMVTYHSLDAIVVYVAPYYSSTITTVHLYIPKLNITITTNTSHALPVNKRRPK